VGGLRFLVISLVVIYGLGYLYAASLVVRFLLVVWTIEQARPYCGTSRPGSGRRPRWFCPPSRLIPE
jgi:hypothetical protein